jgi:hypothetical protein
MRHVRLDRAIFSEVVGFLFFVMARLGRAIHVLFSSREKKVVNGRKSCECLRGKTCSHDVLNKLSARDGLPIRILAAARAARNIERESQVRRHILEQARVVVEMRIRSSIAPQSLKYL